MSDSTSLGEFEHLVLLAVLQLKEEARAIDIRSRIQDRAVRSVSRGALYSALDRLEKKGLLSWEVESSTPERGGIPRRRFIATDRGLAAVRASHQAISSLSEGLEEVLSR
jgi:DNA-binding PadR family transcriptional regulator